MHGHSQVDFSIMSKQRGKKHSCELNNRHLSTKKQCPPSICLQYPLYAILTTKNLSDDTDTLIYLFTGKSGGNPLLHDKFIS